MVGKPRERGMLEEMLNRNRLPGTRARPIVYAGARRVRLELPALGMYMYILARTAQR
jgi:hypothetical protein